MGQLAPLALAIALPVAVVVADGRLLVVACWLMAGHATNFAQLVGC